MTTKPSTYEEKLLELRVRFIRELPKMMDQLAADCAGLMEGHPDPEALVRAHRQAHTLAGTSGTLGFAEVAKDARVLEDWFLPDPEAGRVADRASLGLRLASLLAALNRVRTPEQTPLGGTP